MVAGWSYVDRYIDRNGDVDDLAKPRCTEGLLHKPGRRPYIIKLTQGLKPTVIQCGNSQNGRSTV